MIVLVAFFLFGAAMSGLAAMALFTPGGMLDGLWKLNPEAQHSLGALGPWGPVLLLAVCAACAASAIGLFRQVTWGHRLAVGLLLVNLVANVGNAIFRGDLRTLIGVPIGGVLIAYLVSPRVRQYYRPRVRV
jgi:hypothetical protein